MPKPLRYACAIALVVLVIILAIVSVTGFFDDARAFLADLQSGRQFIALAFIMVALLLVLLWPELGEQIRRTISHHEPDSPATATHRHLRVEAYGPLLERLKKHAPIRFQVNAPYGDDEAHTFGEDIARALTQADWVERDVVERVLYEGPPVNGVMVWWASHDKEAEAAGRALIEFLKAQQIAVTEDPTDSAFAVFARPPIQISVRAR